MRHVIIGNGPAGVTAAETLRKPIAARRSRSSATSRAAVFADGAPYLMMGDIDEAGTYLRKEGGHYARLRIALLRDRVAAVDTAARGVTLAAAAGSITTGC